MTRTLIASVLLAALVPIAFGQEARETVALELGGKQISIEYGRPLLKGRTVAELMKQLPADRVWRAGAGQLTTITTEADLLIGGKRVPAGKYSLYLHFPENGDYSLIVNRDLGQPLSKLFPGAPPERAAQPMPSFSYSKEIADRELARIPLRKSGGPNTEMWTFQLKPAGNGAVLAISWGEQTWSTDIAVSPR